MPLTETQLLRLALMAYEAAAEPALWDEFLRGYIDAVSADLAILQVHDFRRRTSTILSGFGISSRFQASYNEHYSKINLWRERALKQGIYRAGRVNLSEEMCPTTLLERSEFYHDFLRPLDGVCCMGAVIARKGDLAPTLTVNRGRRKPQFGASERNIACFLLPYLKRAWSVYQRLELLQAGESVLDEMPAGVVLLTAGGFVLYCNRAAEEIFRARDGLGLRDAALCASDRRAEAQLRKAVDHALAPDRPLGPAAVAVPRPSWRRAYQVVAAPLRSGFRKFTGMAPPVAVVFITDPENQEPADAELLMQLYGLTTKEAAIAGKLSQGKSVEQAAKEIGMKYQTARTHLRHIFSKTETSRQAELLLLIGRLPAARRDRHG